MVYAGELPIATWWFMLVNWPLPLGGLCW